jgi:hypothetical protein
LLDDLLDDRVELALVSVDRFDLQSPTDAVEGHDAGDNE